MVMYEKHKPEISSRKSLAHQNHHVAAWKISRSDVFNNAAQVYNHTFFWNSMKPQGGGAPSVGRVLDLLNDDFGSWDEFRRQFIQAGMVCDKLINWDFVRKNLEA